MFVLIELSANPLANSGIELGAFNDLSTLYVGIAETKLTAIPKGRISYISFSNVYTKTHFFLLQTLFTTLDMSICEWEEIRSSSDLRSTLVPFGVLCIFQTSRPPSKSSTWTTTRSQRWKLKTSSDTKTFRGENQTYFSTKKLTFS